MSLGLKQLEAYAMGVSQVDALVQEGVESLLYFHQIAENIRRHLEGHRDHSGLPVHYLPYATAEGKVSKFRMDLATRPQEVQEAYLVIYNDAIQMASENSMNSFDSMRQLVTDFFEGKEPEMEPVEEAEAV